LHYTLFQLVVFAVQVWMLFYRLPIEYKAMDIVHIQPVADDLAVLDRSGRAWDYRPVDLVAGKAQYVNQYRELRIVTRVCELTGGYRVPRIVEHDTYSVTVNFDQFTHLLSIRNLAGEGDYDVVRARIIAACRSQSQHAINRYLSVDGSDVALIQLATDWAMCMHDAVRAFRETGQSSSWLSRNNRRVLLFTALYQICSIAALAVWQASTL